MERAPVLAGAERYGGRLLTCTGGDFPLIVQVVRVADRGPLEALAGRAGGPLFLDRGAIADVLDHEVEESPWTEQK